MILRLVLAALVFALAVYAIRYYRKQSPAQQQKLRWRYIAGAVLGLVGLLIVTGRLHWLGGLIAGAVVLLQRSIPLLIHLFPVASRWWRQRSTQSVGSGNVSTVQTDYLRMELDHDSGEMRGDILNGQFAGEKLQNLERPQLEALLQYYAGKHEDSERLLRAYLQRRFGEDFDIHGNNDSQHANDYTGAGDNKKGMNEREALEILGLSAGASNEDVLAAHKKLMQRLHPDRGGSNYLAAKVNQAKDFLLKHNK